MKYYSEMLNKFFETIESCEEAESKEQERIAEAKRVTEEKQNARKKEKKALADAVADAENELTLALENYENVKEKAKEILEKSNREIMDILEPAEETIRNARAKKYTAIAEYNKKYGVYTKYYDNDTLKQELRKHEPSTLFEDLLSIFKL